MGNTGVPQFGGKLMMSIEVNLKSKGAPGWNADMAESKLFVDKVKIIMQALAGIRLEKGFSCEFVVPWPVRRA